MDPNFNEDSDNLTHLKKQEKQTQPTQTNGKTEISDNRDVNPDQAQS